MRPTITLAGQVGYLFEGERAGSYCFVPLHVVDLADLGRVKIDEAEYLRSGWALRNMRGTPIEWTGKYLFPDPDRMITDFSPTPIKLFLARVEVRSTHPFEPAAMKER